MVELCVSEAESEQTEKSSVSVSLGESQEREFLLGRRLVGKALLETEQKNLLLLLLVVFKETGLLCTFSGTILFIYKEIADSYHHFFLIETTQQGPKN